MKNAQRESSPAEASGFLFGGEPSEESEQRSAEKAKKKRGAKSAASKSDAEDLFGAPNGAPNVPTETDAREPAHADDPQTLDREPTEPTEPTPSSTSLPQATTSEPPREQHDAIESPRDAQTIEIAASNARARATQPRDDDPHDAHSRGVKQPSAYQVVARRYRPQTFSELIGQETVARALANAIETDRVGHAYLFTGARGVGKTSCARIFAKALNCVEGPTATPCLKCDSCIGIASGEDVDVLEIDGASNRGVDEIRQLRQNAAVAPSRSLYKIYIIDEVHMLTREAFNALLKTLEEPPSRVKFIFCTTEPNKIPITILSRCQRFDFGNINGGSIASRLAQIAAQEGAQVEDGVFDALARRANGSMRDAQSLLEQTLSFAPNYVSLEAVRNMLGTVDDSQIFEILDATVEGNAGKVFETLGRAATQGVDFGVLVEQTLGAYRDLMIVACGCGVKELMYAPAARVDDLKRIADAFGIRRILASLQILDQTAQRMRFSAQARILAEIAFARLCRLDAFQAIETLVAQLQSGAQINAPFATQDARPSDQGGRDGQKKNS